MKKSLRLVFVDKDVFVLSNWTGEIVRPWEFAKVVRMIRDFSLKPIY